MRWGFAICTYSTGYLSLIVHTKSAFTFLLLFLRSSGAYQGWYWYQIFLSNVFDCFIVGKHFFSKDLANEFITFQEACVLLIFSVWNIDTRVLKCLCLQVVYQFVRLVNNNLWLVIKEELNYLIRETKQETLLILPPILNHSQIITWVEWWLTKFSLWWCLFQVGSKLFEYLQLA